MAAAAPFLLCLSFLQSTPRPPRAEPVPALQGPHAASARPATPAQSPLRGALCRRAVSGKRPGAAERGARKPAGVGGGGRHAPLRLRRPRGHSAGLGPGGRGGGGLRGSGGARGDSRGSPRARAREEEEERGGCGLVQSLGVLAASARRGDGWE